MGKWRGWQLCAAVVVVVSGLAACGGGGGGDSSGTGSGAGTGGGNGGSQAVAPAITAAPASTAVVAGASVTFSVAATGTAPLTYQWARDGVGIPGATGATYSVATTGASDNGARFTVTVSNAAGSATGGPAVLTVNAPAAVALSPRLVAYPGPVQASSLNGPYTPSVSNGTLTVFSDTGSNGATAIAAAGAWFPQGSLMQAEVDTTAGVVRNLHERFRLFMQSGRLNRVDLQASGTPTAARVSTLDVSELCANAEGPNGERFDDWTQPANAVLIYQIKPACENNITPLGNRRYLAVRAGMAPSDPPIALGANRPLAALRDVAGALTGFLVYDGTRLARVDTNFANPTVIATNAAVNDDVIRVVGVYGPNNAPYLLYSYQPFGQPTQLRKVPLTGPSSETVVLSVGSVYAVTADASAVYLAGPHASSGDIELYRLNHSGGVQTLATRLNAGWSELRLRLSATRCLVVARDSVTSVTLNGTDRELFLATGMQIDKAEVLGEDLYLQIRGGGSGTFQDSLVKVMGTDLGNVVDLPRSLLLAPLLQVQHPLFRRHYSSVAWAGLTIARGADPTGVFRFSEATVLTYTPGRTSTVRSVFPALTLGTQDVSPQTAPDMNGNGGYLEWVQSQYLGAYHLGQAGLLTMEAGDTFYLPAVSGAPVQLTRYP